MTFKTSLPRIIAHRGVSSEAPENTLSSVKKALDLGVHCVEIDVRLSKDGTPVVLHDPSASRMAGVKGAIPVSQLTLSEIKEFDVGRHFDDAYIGERIPTLLDVLNLNWQNTHLMIEIKKSYKKPHSIVKAVFQAIEDAKSPPSNILIGSFSHEIIKEAQKQRLPNGPNVEFIGIVEKLNLIDPFISQNVKRIAIWHKMADKDLIHSLTKKGMEVWSFTVDDPQLAQNLIALGIKGIISNDPKLML
jgi:glycerophosphoryl diester phosphodiesterase